MGSPLFLDVKPLVKVFATKGSSGLAQRICVRMRHRLDINFQPPEGLNLSRSLIRRFPNGNLEAEAQDVRGHLVIIIHSQVPPVGEEIIELLALLDAVKNAGAGDIIVVFPYMPYSRSDKKDKPRISIMAKRLASVINNEFGIERVILLDPHDSHIKHYFEPAADEISARVHNRPS